MIGLTLAGIYVLILLAMQKGGAEIFSRATRLLFICWLVFVGAKLLLWNSVVALISTAVALLLGPVVAATVGGILAFTGWTTTLLFSFFQLVGAYLLMTSVVQQQVSGAEWRTRRLAVGAVFVALGLFHFPS